MTINTRFKGTVLMYSDRKGFAKKSDVKVEFDAAFADNGTWTVTKQQFGTVVISDISTPDAHSESGNAMATQGFELRVSLNGTAKGSYDPVAGKLSITGTFRFFVAMLASKLTITLDGGTYTLAQPPASVVGQGISDASGAMCLAAKGQFVSGHLQGNTCLVQIQGDFDPKPW